jgi:hypothetical protein
MATLKTKIMRQVYLTWFWRQVAPLLAVEAILVVGVLVGVLANISLRSILMNALAASDSIKAFLQFFVDNFLLKSIQSKLLLASFAALAFFFVRDLRNTLRKLKQNDTLVTSLIMNETAARHAQ